jgi:hypothetical protein
MRGWPDPGGHNLWYAEILASYPRLDYVHAVNTPLDAAVTRHVGGLST